MPHLPQTDPEIAEAIQKELKRQQEGLVMIPSENFTSPAVLEATGTVPTNKYSEGYPSRRYYSGNQYIDVIENLAIERAKKLFGAEHANVQPHSGSSANMEAYFAFLELGDKILSMRLDHGGHLTHGSPVNFSGKFYNFVFYGVRPDSHLIDLDEVYEIAKKEKPKMILAGYTAYPRQIDFKSFGEISREVGAYFMVDIAHIAGLVVAGEHQDPVPYADVVTTTTHKTLRGPRGAIILCPQKYSQRIDKAVMPGMQGGPLEHVIAAKAVCFKEAMSEEFKEYQRQIVRNAKALAESLRENGLKLISGGTDTHLILIDCTNLSITGKEGANSLAECNIYTNFNMIPYDTGTPLNPSGIRLGTPALTTRGFKEEEMKITGKLISQVLDNSKSEEVKEKARKKVQELTEKYPLYPEL